MVAARPLGFDPVLDAMERAPEEHEPLTPEQEEECQRAKGEPAVSLADLNTPEALAAAAAQLRALGVDDEVVFIGTTVDELVEHLGWDREACAPTS
jgi:nucleotide-binding universal stress UspA family protein